MSSSCINSNSLMLINWEWPKLNHQHNSRSFFFVQSVSKFSMMIQIKWNKSSSFQNPSSLFQHFYYRTKKMCQFFVIKTKGRHAFRRQYKTKIKTLETILFMPIFSWNEFFPKCIIYAWFSENILKVPFCTVWSLSWNANKHFDMRNAKSGFFGQHFACTSKNWIKLYWRPNKSFKWNLSVSRCDLLVSKKVNAQLFTNVDGFFFFSAMAEWRKYYTFVWEEKKCLWLTGSRVQYPKKHSKMIVSTNKLLSFDWSHCKKIMVFNHNHAPRMRNIPDRFTYK